MLQDNVLCTDCRGCLPLGEEKVESILIKHLAQQIWIFIYLLGKDCRG